MSKITYVEVTKRVGKVHLVTTNEYFNDPDTEQRYIENFTKYLHEQDNCFISKRGYADFVGGMLSPIE